MEEPARDDEVLRWGLDVQDAGAGRHPLGVAVRDDPTAAVGILVLDDAIDHVRHGFEAAVGMPGRALWFTGGVLDRSHLVQVDERVEQRHIDTGERAPNGESLTLEAARGGGHRAHGAFDRIDGQWLGNAGQGKNVAHGHGGHGFSSTGPIVAYCNY